jgi:hypothetical protein
VLLVGAIILSALSGVRLIGLLPRETDVWLLIAFEAGDTLGYMLAGLGAVLVSMRAREKPG